ncbi:MAG: hypothetical protein RIK87_23740 [Fuerstiella sp.]
MDTPELIHAIATETEPDFSDGGAWNDVYSSLFHQGTMYTATYAAFPHIVSATITGTVNQRTALLCLAGSLRVHGYTDDEIPQDLIPDYENGMTIVRSASHNIVQTSWGTADIYTRAELLEAFGGLRHPQCPYVVQLGHMAREMWRVESNCPHCDQTAIVDMYSDGLKATQHDNRGGLVESTATNNPVDRSNYNAELQASQSAATHDPWPEDQNARVLAGLAHALGDRTLADKILDLGTRIECPYCHDYFLVANGLSAL